MFHGCRSQENEDKILDHGFQVSQCVSGGANYGTWFAYNASYSDGGYAHVDSDGMKHLFLNIVSDAQVALECADICRVVGQDCAYPVWLVRYLHLCPGNCAAYCYSDYGDECDDYDYYYVNVCEGGLPWKTLREAEKVTATLRESRRRGKCQAKCRRLGCIAELRRGRKGQPLKRGGRHKVGSLILQLDEYAS
jgi:hypothetical protein